MVRKQKKENQEIISELHKKEDELKERIKELNCIYNVTEILEKGSPDMDQVLQRAVNTIPPAMKYPEVAEASVTIGNNTYCTERFAERTDSLSADIMDGSDRIGKITVVYLERKPTMDIGPFYKEELKLLRVLSENLAKYVREHSKDAKIKNYMFQLNSILSAKGSSLDHLGFSGKGDEWKIIVELLQKTDSQTYLGLSRKMMYHLARKYGANLESIMNVISTDEGTQSSIDENIPNPRFDIKALIGVMHGVFDLAESTMDSAEIMGLIIKWLKENQARPLLIASEQNKIPLKEISSALDKYSRLPETSKQLPPELDRTIRTNLVRRFLNERLEYIRVATKYLTIADFEGMLERFIGDYNGVGGLGGKASMIFLVERIIQKELENDQDIAGIKFARSYFIGTDVMREFIHYNALEDIVQVKYMESSEVRKEQPFMEQLFKNGSFTPEIVAQLKNLLRDFRDRPIIVRSSSHLEDSYGAAFSGKYKSLFITNRGTEEERLNSLMDALAEVWASTFGPNPIEYRRERGMLDLNENMGVLVQQVVGNEFGEFFAPSFAGVAMTNNEFRWSPRINRKDGILRLVVGLGTRAVDRVSDDYPLLISPKKPGIRVNTTMEDLIRYSQQSMDVINLRTNTLEMIPIQTIAHDHRDEYPMLDKLMSKNVDGNMVDGKTMLMSAEEPEEWIVTFNGIIDKSNFIRQMRKVMTTLNEVLNTPVDIEFAHDGKDLYILQCRPQSQGLRDERITIPQNIMEKDVFFKANKYVTTGIISNVDYIVYVDGEKYEALSQKEDLIAVARTVSRLNSALPKRKFILMGPGRWGSRGDIKLGVPVQYGDINNTSMLIEIARVKGGYVPELSFGTHFFQDLVEANIHYLPLYPDGGGSYLNFLFIDMTQNVIGEILPDIRGKMSEVVKVIKTADLSSGGSMRVIMDGERGEALAYLTMPDHTSWRLERIDELVADLDPKAYGVEGLYLVGSVKENRAGPASDIDLIALINGTQVELERFEDYIREWSESLDEENFRRTGIRTGGLIDLHIVTQLDIVNKTSWATHIGSIYNPARKLQLKK
jgi:pyruvate,water dikinase